MNLPDLRVFTVVARHDSLHAAAAELHLTPSAVSKALRRLEEELGLPLFDRSTRQLVLNERGAMLLARARVLLDLAEQARIDLQGESAAMDCRIGGPAVLLWRHGGGIADALQPYPGARQHLHPLFEGDALAALARGELHAALVTDEALDSPHWSPQWEATALGELALGVIAASSHPLAGRRRKPVDVKDVLAHPFASPARSLFCGQARGSRSDGWRDDLLPRTIRYWADDLQVLLGLVRAGRALAYLPAFAAQEYGLVGIKVADLGFSSVERLRLVWNPARAAMAARPGG
ncbi:LysR family transcriptional regulator [Massilia sp. ST3]|uniref:LysR family transcriptional regulator n=1 Tax=Massilia sp. ST3 TaxID=2824903 RepID=UPI001B8140DB|nr:LysR family transcriptional regulator [Massilia sp. ST3]MBQ5947153.1 LysR family transcriptional regulator [Massilia sp. ST3]